MMNDHAVRVALRFVGELAGVFMVGAAALGLRLSFTDSAERLLEVPRLRRPDGSRVSRMAVVASAAAALALAVCLYRGVMWMLPWNGTPSYVGLLAAGLGTPALLGLIGAAIEGRSAARVSRAEREALMCIVYAADDEDELRALMNKHSTPAHLASIAGVPLYRAAEAAEFVYRRAEERRVVLTCRETMVCRTS